MLTKFLVVVQVVLPIMCLYRLSITSKGNSTEQWLCFFSDDGKQQYIINLNPVHNYK